jgi:hypothetical protein
VWLWIVQRTLNPPSSGLSQLCPHLIAFLYRYSGSSCTSTCTYILNCFISYIFTRILRVQNGKSFQGSEDNSWVYLEDSCRYVGVDDACYNGLAAWFTINLTKVVFILWTACSTNHQINMHLNISTMPLVREARDFKSLCFAVKICFPVRRFRLLCCPPITGYQQLLARR